MQLILTHEQADFDAIGALTAAHLLFNTAIPILPRKMNQNVRKFINLYKSELPFVELVDLPGEPIDSVTLVDTQSLITLKNIRKDATINIIDHHQPKLDLPPQWHTTIEKTGATTTILVNQLKEQNMEFSPLEATVMLLGIHEDTGSLTYASTVVKDVYAAAYLVEKGADLQLLNDYLNPPLSAAQLSLADEILRNARLSSINGKKILISQAVAMELDEEISSIAHKIRDLLDPDALFLLVRGKEGVRLVARSTTDDVDVSQVALLFGGGGHARAAAALIHVDDKDTSFEKDLLDVAAGQIIEHLQKTIKPAVTVGKIMSKKPLLITQKTSLQDALLLMKRYGYEGYPVIDGNEVVGLLTRRSMDKAVSHKLDLNAGSLMDAGNYSLTPDQTLDDVQELMATTGWGQIPVIDPSSRAIIGIVTRTDLLKNLRKLTPVKSSTLNYAQKIKKALSPGRSALLQKVIEVANKHNLPIYTVGGFVRDLLLDRPSLDFDIVIEGDAIKVANELSDDLGGRVVSHRRFGTAKWQLKEVRISLAKEFAIPVSQAEELPEFLDLISARTEFYDHPTALPTVERSSIKMDIHRRDFTINTLAFRLDSHHFGELYDHWGGLKDLNDKKIRVLHSLSFVDDPTRALRAVRFEQRFDFQIEDRTRQLMEEACSMLRQVSGDRLRHEFDLAFKESDPTRILKRMDELDLLAQIHPMLHWDPALTAPMKSIRIRRLEQGWDLQDHVGNIPLELALHWLVWLGSLPPKITTEISRRFKFPAPLAAHLLSVTKILAALPTLGEKKPSQITVFLETFPEISLYAAFLLTSTPETRDLILRFIQKWKNFQPATNGDVLLKSGLLPGPAYKRILSSLRAAYLDGVISTTSEESQLLSQILDQD